MSIPPPDWILTGARLWTGGPECGVPRPGMSVAIRGARIVAVGADEEVLNLRGPRTAVIELEGRFLGPGFVDAHVHLLPGGLGLFRVELRGSGSPEELERRVNGAARGVPADRWILGGGWNHQEWGGEMPHRSWLDRAAGGLPVILHRMDLHVAVVSSRALELAGIGPDTPDPPNGRIDRDPRSGEPTGVLREEAILLVSRVVPGPTPAERREALRAAARYLLARGVTQVQDMGALHTLEESWASLELLRELRAEGGLPIRVSAALPLPQWRRAAEFVREAGRGDALLRWGGVKGFVDGSLGAATAWFHEPYDDDPANHGAPISELDELEAAIRGAVGAGLQPIVHAIGDRATDWLYDVYEGVAGGRPGEDLRLRMEHAQHLSPERVHRIPGPPVVHSVQPTHLTDDGVWATRRLGLERERRAYPFGTILSGGGRVAFGSDWPVVPPDPLVAIRAATTRMVRRAAAFGEGASGATPWIAGERVPLAAAFEAHTLGGAMAAFLDGETGSVEVGKRADLVVLSEDPFSEDALRGHEGSGEQVPGSADALAWEWAERVQVDMTFVDGILAHHRDDPATGGVG